MIRVSVAIDNRLYYQVDIKTDNVELGVLILVVEIAGTLWERAEWYVNDDNDNGSAGVIIK